MVLNNIIYTIHHYERNETIVQDKIFIYFLIHLIKYDSHIL